MLAESAGLRLGLALAQRVLGHPVALEVLGDNLPVLRLAAANGRLRNDTCWQIFHEALMHTAAMRWAVKWIAVRRSQNKFADLLATRGTVTSVRICASGSSDAHLWLWIHPDYRDINWTFQALPWHDDQGVTWSDRPLHTEGPTWLAPGNQAHP